MFRMPAEWDLHDAVWTAWPHDPDQWLEGLEPPQRALMAMVAAIADVDRGRPRDTGPIFVTRPGELSAARFQFDGWGGKYLMDGDAEVAAHVIARTGVRGAEFDFVLEGGAVEVDGEGTVLTTRQCLLGGARNPGLDQDALDARLRWALGAERVVWLDRGLANDHTDGHIDTLARFVTPGVVACMEPAADDPNRDALAGAIADLQQARTAGGERLEVITVPSPGAV